MWNIQWLWIYKMFYWIFAYYFNSFNFKAKKISVDNTKQKFYLTLNCRLLIFQKELNFHLMFWLKRAKENKSSVMQTSKKVILSLTSQVTAELVIKFHLAIDMNAKNKTQLPIKFFHKWVKAQGYMWSSQWGENLFKRAFLKHCGSCQNFICQSKKM